MRSWLDASTRLARLAATLGLAACATSDPVGDEATESAANGVLSGSNASAGEGSASNGSEGAGASGAGNGASSASSPQSSSSTASGSSTPSSSGSGGGSSASSGSGTPPGCGNGTVEAGEECDDGDLMTGDGCDDTCVIECNSNAIKNMLTGHCYRLFEVSMKASDAEAACQSWGGAPGLGHLVSIDGAAEQGFIGQLAIKKAWMGGGDAATEGTYAWYDGTPWTYENWADGEPNDTTVEDCMFLQIGGKWDDHDCNDPRPAYLCERRGAGTF